MRSMRILAIACVAMIGAMQPLHAREAIEHVPGKAWQHPHAALTIPATLAGLQRVSGNSYADDYLDIGFTFLKGSDEITLYVYRNTNGSVPIWFAQAQDMIEARDQYAQPQLAGPVEPIKPAGSRTASGLKAIYQPGADSSYASTGLVLFATGEWYVKLRASSVTLSVERLSAMLDKAISELAVPKGAAAGPSAMPIEDCKTQLAYSDSTQNAPKDPAANLLGGLMAKMASEKASAAGKGAGEDAPALQWCRDSQVRPGLAAYRHPDNDRYYLLAAGDNGNALSVGPDAASAVLAAENKRDHGERYSVTLIQAAKNSTLPAQDGFPSPRRAFEIVNRESFTTSVSTWGDSGTLQIGKDLLE